jgi:hypothetical protein
VLLLVLALAAGGVYGLRGSLTGLTDPVLDRLRGTELINPDRLSASSEAPGQPAALARDGATNLFWAPAGDPIGQFVEAGFASPVRLVHLRVFTGASNEGPVFLASGRPTALRITLLRDGEPDDVRDVVLKDEPGPQVVDLGVSDVTTVRVTVLAVEGLQPGGLAALGELEFLGRR